jgi:hypothetical protein
MCVDLKDYYLHGYIIYIITITCFFLVCVSFLGIKLISAKYVQAHLVRLALYLPPLMAQLPPALGAVYSCMLLGILPSGGGTGVSTGALPPYFFGGFLKRLQYIFESCSSKLAAVLIGI